MQSTYFLIIDYFYLNSGKMGYITVKKIIVILLYSSLGFIYSACEQNEPEDEPQENLTQIRFRDEDINKIEKIKISRAVKVVAFDTNESFVSVSGGHLDVEKIKIEIADTTLYIYLDGNIRGGNPVKVEVGLKNSLHEISVSKAAKLKINHESQAKDILITASTASTMVGSISSKGSMRLNVSDASKFDGQLISNNLNILSSQASEVIVTGNGYLDSVICKKASRVDITKFENTGRTTTITKDVSSKVDLAANY